MKANVADLLKEIGLRDRCYKGEISVSEYLASAVLPASRTDPIDIATGIFTDVYYAGTVGYKALCANWKKWLGRKLREMRLDKAFAITHRVGHSARFNKQLVFFKVAGLRNLIGKQFEQPVYVLGNGKICFQTFDRIHSDDQVLLRKELAEYQALHKTGGSEPEISADMLTMEDITWVS